MSKIVPFRQKPKHEPKPSLEFAVDGVTLLSQYGSRLEIRRDRETMLYMIDELQHTLDTVRETYGQIFADQLPNLSIDLSSACPDAQQSPVLSIVAQNPENDN